MSTTMWTFRYREGGWTRLTQRWLDRLFKGEVVVTDAGTEGLLTATVLVELEDRAPLRIDRPRFDRWPLLPGGALDTDATQRSALNALDLLLEPLAPLPASNVIAAEARFNKRRHQTDGRWTPTRQQLTLLVAALERAGITPGVARRLLDDL